MKNNVWPAKDVEIFSWDELPLSRLKSHGEYRLISRGMLFKIIVSQELFAEKSSIFHHHPAPEILFLHSGRDFFIETDNGRKWVKPGSTVYIPPNVIHRVMNLSLLNSKALILIEKGYRDKDVVYVKRDKGKWVEVDV